MGEQTIYLRALPEDRDMVSGRFPPQRVKAEQVDTANILIRSTDRTSGNNFNFYIDLKTSTAHLRKIQLAKIMMPLLPQINKNNMGVTVTHRDAGVDSTVSFDLIPGYYSVQSYVNMLQAQFLAAWQSIDPTNAVTISYDIDGRSITITDDNSESFYIHDDCNFALYAINVSNFTTEAAGSIPSKTSFTSLSLGMIYSRYITVQSFRLTEDQKTFSTISGLGPSNIVAIIDIASKYGSAQFTVSSSFPGTDVVIDTLSYAPVINVLNRNKSIRIIDIQMIDEFQFPLSNINSGTYPFQYPVAMWFQCYL